MPRCVVSCSIDPKNETMCAGQTNKEGTKLRTNAAAVTFDGGVGEGTLVCFWTNDQQFRTINHSEQNIKIHRQHRRRRLRRVASTGDR